MKCEKVRNKILIEGLGEPEVREHIEHCAGCAIFADSLEKFSTAKPDESSYVVPGWLDEQVKNQARDFLAERTSRPAAPNMPYNNFASYFAMAATIVLVSWLFVSLVIPKRGTAGDHDASATSNAMASSSAELVSLDWNDKEVEDDLFSIDADIEFTFALMNNSSDDAGDSMDNSDNDTRFTVVVPDLLT